MFCTSILQSEAPNRKRFYWKFTCHTLYNIQWKHCDCILLKFKKYRFHLAKNCTANAARVAFKCCFSLFPFVLWPLIQECPSAWSCGSVLALVHTSLIRSHLLIWRVHHRAGDAEWVKHSVPSRGGGEKRNSQVILKACRHSFRWCLAVLCEQKWMEALQTQSHAETKVSVTESTNAAVLSMSPMTCLAIAVSQAVAHSVFRPRRKSVCVRRMCQQSVVSTQSCKTGERSIYQILFFYCMIFSSTWFPLTSFV